MEDSTFRTNDQADDTESQPKSATKRFCLFDLFTSVFDGMKQASPCALRNANQFEDVSFSFCTEVKSSEPRNQKSGVIVSLFRSWIVVPVSALSLWCRC